MNTIPAGISTGMASQVAFNALKKGGTVMVYPIAAKQMQGGTLVDVTAKSWQDGAWAEWWNGYFLNGNNQYSGVTGGWTGDGTISINGIYLEAANTASFNKYQSTNNAINFAEISSIIFKVTSLYNVQSKYVKFTVQSVPNMGGTELASLLLTTQDTGEYTLNTDGITGAGYIVIMVGNTSNVTVESIRKGG